VSERRANAAGAAVGLVLAAGAGTRFGDEPKQLADLAGRPVLQHVVDAALAALPRVVVVLGHRADRLRAAVDLGPAEVVVCDDWAAGQSASLRAGLDAIGGAHRVVVLLGDQPLLAPALIERFAGEPGGTRSSHAGAPGHPAVLGPAEIAAARELTGDAGLRDLEWRLVEVGRPLRDIDTPEDLEAVRREARAIV
jgi:molybdenum cofactor cytidylyltransferase